MRVPHAATLWSYGKRPAIALLEAITAELREAHARHQAAYPRETGTPTERTRHIKVSELRLEIIQKFERRLHEVKKWPDTPHG